MAPITIATMKQSRTFIAAVLAILALSTVGLFAGRDRASVAVPQPQEHRSLRSLSLSSVYYDPKTVTPRDPQILAVTVDDSQTPPQNKKRKQWLMIHNHYHRIHFAIHLISLAMVKKVV